MSAALGLLNRLLTFGAGMVVGAIGILVLLGVLLYVCSVVADAMEECDEDYLW